MQDQINKKKRQSNRKKKCASDLNAYFTEVFIQITFEQIFNITNQQGYENLKYNEVPGHINNEIKYTDNIKCWQLDSHTLLVGVQGDITTLENCQKSEHMYLQDPAIGTPVTEQYVISMIQSFHS